MGTWQPRTSANRAAASCCIAAHVRAPLAHAVLRARHAVRGSLVLCLYNPHAVSVGRHPPAHPTKIVREGEALRSEADACPANERTIVLLPTARPDPRAWPESRWIELASPAGSERSDAHVCSGSVVPTRRSWDVDSHERLSGRRSGSMVCPHNAGSARPLRCCATLDRERRRSPWPRTAGPMNLAVAAGLRVMTLSADRRTRTGPAPSERSTFPCVSAGELSCRPCLKRRCRLAAGPRCLDEISAEEVRACDRAHASNLNQALLRGPNPLPRSCLPLPRRDGSRGLRGRLRTRPLRSSVPRIRTLLGGNGAFAEDSSGATLADRLLDAEADLDRAQDARTRPGSSAGRSSGRGRAHALLRDRLAPPRRARRSRRQSRCAGAGGGPSERDWHARR